MPNSSKKTRRGSPSPSRLPLPPDRPTTTLPQSDEHAVTFESAAGFPAAPTAAYPPAWPTSGRPATDPGSPPDAPPSMEALLSETCAVTSPIASSDDVASPVVVITPPDEERPVFSAPTLSPRGPPSPAKPLEPAMMPGSTHPTEQTKRAQNPGGRGASPPRGTETALPATSPLHTAERPSASPVEPEQHVSGDAVESIIRKLKGTRPDLLRTATYYEGAKGVYITLAGLPVLNCVAPVVESVTESIINMTPLKPSPEEAEQKSVALLDRKICEALAFADDVVDAKKDDTIEGLVSVKKAIHTLGPVQNVVGVACDVGDGVGKAYGSANDTVGSVWNQVFGAVWYTYCGATEMAGGAVNNVTNTTGAAVNHVTATTGNVVESAKCTAGHTVDGLKSVVGNTTDAVGSTISSLFGAVMYYPMSILNSIMGNNTEEPTPEE